MHEQIKLATYPSYGKYLLRRLYHMHPNCFNIYICHFTGTTSMRCVSNPFKIIKLIKLQNVFVSIIRKYTSS